MSWTSASASRTGPGHADIQDFHAAAANASGRLVVVVADGAGSAPRSAEGAEAATLAAMDAAFRATDMGAPAASCAETAVRCAIEQLAGDRSQATTLTVVVADPPDLPGATAGVAAVGDSPAMVATADGWFLCQVPRLSEYVNETEFLTSTDPQVGTWTLDASRLVALAVGSDGIANFAVGPGGVPHAGMLDPLVARARAGTLDLGAFLDHVESVRGLDDDTTLVLAWA